MLYNINITEMGITAICKYYSKANDAGYKSLRDHSDSLRHRETETGARPKTAETETGLEKHRSS